MDVPFALQWARRSAFFSFKNLTLWGLGLPLGILAWLVFVVVAWRDRLFSPGRFVMSGVGFLLGIVLLVACAQLAWSVIKAQQAVDLAVDSGFEGSAAWQAGLMSLGALLMIVVLSFSCSLWGCVSMGRFEQKEQEAQAALLVSQERYAAAVRGANDGIWDWDLDTDTIWYSDGLRTHFGLAPSDVRADS